MSTRNFNRHVYDRTDGMFGDRRNDGVSFRISLHEDGVPTEVAFNVAVTNADEGDRFSRKEANTILKEKAARGQDEFYGTYHHSLTAVQNCLLTLTETYLDRRHRGVLDDNTARFIKRVLRRAENVIERNSSEDGVVMVDDNTVFDTMFVSKLLDRIER